MASLCSNWLTFTILIYIISAGFAYLRNRSNKYKNKYKILITSVAFLTISSLILPKLVYKGMGFLWGPPSNYNYKEVKTDCTNSTTIGPKILYSGDQEEWISDLSGGEFTSGF